MFIETFILEILKRFPSLDVYSHESPVTYRDIFDIFDLDVKAIADVLLVEEFYWMGTTSKNFIITKNKKRIHSYDGASYTAGSDYIGCDEFMVIILEYILSNYTDDYVKFKLI